MILFFRTPQQSVIAVESDHTPDQREAEELSWLFGEAKPESEENLKGYFVGPRREMITPWSTNAVEITQNMGLKGIARIEEYLPVADENADHATQKLLAILNRNEDKPLYVCRAMGKETGFIMACYKNSLGQKKMKLFNIQIFNKRKF